MTDDEVEAVAVSVWMASTTFIGDEAKAEELFAAAINRGHYIHIARAAISKLDEMRTPRIVSAAAAAMAEYVRVNSIGNGEIVYVDRDGFPLKDQATRSGQ